jgi:hypothetical protein
VTGFRFLPLVAGGQVVQVLGVIIIVGTVVLFYELWLDDLDGVGLDQLTEDGVVDLLQLLHFELRMHLQVQTQEVVRVVRYHYLVLRHFIIRRQELSYFLPIPIHIVPYIFLAHDASHDVSGVDADLQTDILVLHWRLLP